MVVPYALRLSYAVDGMRHPSRQAGAGSDAAKDIAIVLAFALTALRPDATTLRRRPE